MTGWFTLDQNYTSEQFAEIQEAVFQQATAQGIDLTQYSHILFFLPALQGAGLDAGLSYVGCTDLMQGSTAFNASLEWIFPVSGASNVEFLQVTFHEFGHGLGLLHSTSLDCGAVSLPPDPTTCQVFQYGDAYSVMGGGSLGHFTTPQKYALGWIQDAQVVTIPSTGTATLAPVSAQGTGMRAIRTPRTVGGTDWMWIEAREPVGPYDSANLNSDGIGTIGGIDAGAVVHFQPQSAGGAIADLTQSQLVDIPPAGEDDEPLPAAVAPGSSWTDVFSGLTMSVTQGTGSALNVTVSRNNACFTLNSSTATVAGSGGTGTVHVTAPASCSWSASSNDSWLSIQSGASGSGNGTLTFLAATNTGAARQGVLLIGGLGVLISQAPQTAGPQVLPLSPATVTGPSAFLNLSVNDNTPFNFSTVTFNITSGPPAQPLCEMAWNEPGHQFLLTNDDGVNYSVASDSSFLIDLENSTCAILIASPGFYGDNSAQFSFEVEVVWKNPTGGSQKIYLRAQDVAGNDTGWQSVGTWTTTADQPPSQPVLPNVPGTGLNHLFTIEASDPDGAGDIQSVELDIGTGTQRCSMIYAATIQSGVEFLNDDGTRSGWLIDIPGTASNSYCSLDLLRAGSSTSGNTETVLLPLTFLSTLSGQQPVQVIVTDWSGKTGTLNTTWNVAASSSAPTITASGIVNGASWQAGGIASGGIVTIFGSNLGPPTLETSSVVDNELQRTVAGTSVFFEGTVAPLIYVSQSAVTAIVPPFMPQTVHVEVTTTDGFSNVVTVPSGTPPGIFTYASSQQAVAVNQDFSFNIDKPAARGSYLTLYVTGTVDLGYDNAEFLDFGGVPPSNPWATAREPFLVKFGSETPVQASFAGLVFPGVVQVNALIDSLAPTGDAVPVQVIPSAYVPNIISPVATVRIK